MTSGGLDLDLTKDIPRESVGLHDDARTSQLKSPDDEPFEVRVTVPGGRVVAPDAAEVRTRTTPAGQLAAVDVVFAEEPARAGAERFLADVARFGGDSGAEVVEAADRAADALESATGPGVTPRTVVAGVAGPWTVEISGYAEAEDDTVQVIWTFSR